ncbi:hypothetical protein [Halomonas litopenaei]|uniref:hypothetical protein n=1 Tax=Halomonas litopenaei TaxID=2109328 RepID=UPI001A8D9FA6|nr:hypothetical protein [Halomonas litopenaei]MBN8413005.1 hypothetical protein [Halomonas litopenaei]
MTHEQAAELVSTANDLLALGDKLDAAAHALADEGQPQSRYQPLVDATGHIAGAICSTLDALTDKGVEGRTPR